MEVKTHKGLIVRNIMWGNLNTILRYVLAFVATSFLAKTFAPDVFGTYQLVISYLAIFEALLPVSSTHLRNYLAAHPDKEPVVSSLWFWQNMLVFVFVALVCAFGIVFSDESSFWLLLFIASIRFVFRFNEHTVIVCDQRLLSHLAQKIAIAQNIFLSVLRIIAALLRTNIYLLCATSPIQGLFSALYQYRVGKQTGIKFSVKLDISEFLQIFRSGFFISILSFASVFQTRVISLVLAEYLSKEDFGNFQLVIKLIEPATMLGMIVIGANYSVLANSLQESAKVFAKRYAKICFLTLLISATLAAVIYVIPPSWVVRFFGAQYIGGLSLLRIASLLVVSNTLVWVDQNYDFLRQDYIFALVKYSVILALYVVSVVSFNTKITIEDGLWISILVPLTVTIPSLTYRTISYYRSL